MIDRAATFLDKEPPKPKPEDCPITQRWRHASFSMGFTRTFILTRSGMKECYRRVAPINDDLASYYKALTATVWKRRMDLPYGIEIPDYDGPESKAYHAESAAFNARKPGAKQTVVPDGDEELDNG